MDVEMRNYLTVSEIAKIVGMHPNTIRNAIHKGKLSSIRFGTGKNSPYRIPKSELERLALVDLKEIFDIKE